MCWHIVVILIAVFIIGIISMIRYHDKRLICAQKLAGASLVYHMGPKTKTNKEERN